MPDTLTVDHAKAEVIGANDDEVKRVTVRAGGTLLRSYEPGVSRDDFQEKAEPGDQFVIASTIHVVAEKATEPVHLTVERLPVDGAIIVDRSAPSDFKVEEKPKPKKSKKEDKDA